MMKTSKRNWMVVFAVLTFSVSTFAFPPSAVNTNNNCTACHDTTDNSRVSVFGEDGTLEVNGTGPLKVFNVMPGGTKDLGISALVGDEDYAFQIKDFEDAGLVNATSLAFTPDVDWFEQSNATPPYYTIPQFGGLSWNGQDDRTFTIEIPAEAPADVYKLVFAVADGDFNYGEEEFLLNVIPEPAASVLFAAAAAWLLTHRKNSRT